MAIAKDLVGIFFTMWLLLSLAGFWSHPHTSFQAVPGLSFKIVLLLLLVIDFGAGLEGRYKHFWQRFIVIIANGAIWPAFHNWGFRHPKVAFIS